MALRSDDGTVLTRADLDALLTPVADPDPLVTIGGNVYEDEGFENASDRGRRLKWRAGAQVRQSEIDAAYAVPTVTAVGPNNGTAAGGTAVTVTGTGFQSGIQQDASQGTVVQGGGTTGVTFGGAAATNVQVVSDTEITCTTPAHAAGAVAVVVTTDAGASAPLAGGYTYA
jgi:hypothetical protein